MAQRYDIRPDERGWTVFDRFTGQYVVINGVPQTGMDIQMRMSWRSCSTIP